MTATSTRSTRRAEGPVQRATRHHNHLLAQQSNSSRPLKRLHEATNLSYDIKPVKKAKFEIEIPSKTQYQARFLKDHQHSHRSSRLTSLSAIHNSPPKHDASSRQTTTAPPPLAPEPTPAPTPAPAPALAQSTARTTQKNATTAKDKDTNPNALTKHNQKVVNGIKHELDRLQPSSADMANSNTQGRKLRSQEGVRYKSELSAYFPEYDEVIGNIPKEHRMFMCPF